MLKHASTSSLSPSALTTQYPLQHTHTKPSPNIYTNFHNPSMQSNATPKPLCYKEALQPHQGLLSTQASSQIRRTKTHLWKYLKGVARWKGGLFEMRIRCSFFHLPDGRLVTGVWMNLNFRLCVSAFHIYQDHDEMQHASMVLWVVVSSCYLVLVSSGWFLWSC